MNPKQHAKRNTVLRVIAFLLIVALVYGALTRLLTINNATEQQYIRSFYLEPKNSLDVMILGASETFTDYCAPLAWQHAGFTSYPLAVSAAQGTLYASMLRESAKRQNPSVYVVEVNGFLYTEAERDELGTAATREWLDTLPLSRSKVQAIDECVQGDRLSYYVPLLKYHDNWRKPDLIRNSLSLQQQARDAGYSYTKPFLSISMFLTETDEIPVRQQSLDDFNEQSLRTFCETAKARGIKNVLFARFPHRTVIENYDAVFAELEAVVHEYGYDFANFDTQMDAIGLDPLNDFANAEHLNIFGAEKFTPYLADYLAQHYDLNTAHSPGRHRRMDALRRIHAADTARVRGQHPALHVREARRILARIRRLPLNKAKRSPLRASRRGLRFLSFYRPVLPKPPAPRSVSSSASASANSAARNGRITSWAMRSPGATVRTSSVSLCSATVHSPR